MKEMRQRLGLLLSATVLLTSVFPTSVLASTGEQNVRDIVAEEIAFSSRLDGSTANEQLEEVKYSDDELVTVIVEMDENPVLDYFNSDSECMVGDADATNGEVVAEFLASDAAQEISEELIDGQNEIVEQLEEAADEVEVIAQWTNVTNAMAVKVPYGELKNIKKMDGVKQAYVQHVYERPEENTTTVDLTKANYEYSLDMIGTTTAWNAGYTGKGILVAILDSGLDVIQDKTNGEYIGSHEAFTSDSFASGNPEDGENDWELRFNEASMTEFLANTALWANTSAVDETSHITYDNNALYKNLKVPYGYDYADYDVNVRPASSNHGTHVAGTIAGYVESEEGEVVFSGVAPDAQILAMKVFPDADGGAEELSLVCAIEDALKLGADIVNLSLGSDSGFADDGTMEHDAFARAEEAGIVMMTAAGNSDDATSDNNYGGSLTSNPETSVMSSPAIYNSNLCVASIDNTVNVESYLTANVDGESVDIAYKDTTEKVAASFLDGTYPIYLVDGVGSYNDYYNANFNNGWNGGKTGIALVKRGELTFDEKLSNAANFHGTNSRGEAYGIIGVIVYDSNPEGTDLVSMSLSGSSIPACFISGKDGAALEAALKEGKTVTFNTHSEDRIIEGETAGQMSVFSSWGAGPALELKPEITAPGGNIWSTVMNKTANADASYTGKYEMMSGTSMATPHMAGAGALIKQRVLTDSAFAGYEKDQLGDLVSQLLVSTAVPQKDANGVYYSPRQQGSGLVNVGAAATTNAFVTVEGQNFGKLELGDDVNRTGSYDMVFDIHNVGSQALTYNMKVVLMRPDVESEETYWGTRDLLSLSDVVIEEVSFGNITVAAGDVKHVDKTVSLSTSVKAEMDRLFENGMYVEGYVILEAVTDNTPDLGLPVLAFYGDWTEAPIFDTANWLDAQDGEDVYENECTWNNTIFGSTLMDSRGNVIGYYNLAQNVFQADEYDQRVFHEENIALSPNGDGYMDKIDDIIIYTLRNARVIVLEAKDANTGELYYRDYAACVRKTTYETGYYAVPYIMMYEKEWDGTDLNGNVLPNGTEVIFTATAYTDGDYSELGEVEDDYYHINVTDFSKLVPGEVEPTYNGHKMNMTGDVISFPVLIDTSAPKLVNNTVSVYEKDGRTYIKGTVYDEIGSLASVEVVPLVKRTYKYNYRPEYYDYALDRNNAFYSNTIYDANLKTLTFEADVTEYVHEVESYQGENNTYDFTWDGNVYISCGDYGANDRTYAIKVDATPGIVLSQTSALLHPGDKFELSVNDNTGKTDAITRTSSNTEVATIDEYGNVVAVGEGQAVITVSNGTDSAVCIVAVEAKPTEVISFDLSVSKIDALKPDGQATVNVTNLYPADVELSSIIWSVEEDEDYANDYAAGLISVEKNAENGLSGNVYMNVSASEDLLPAGHALLTVSLNGVSRTVDITWDDVYTSNSQDDIIPNASYKDQIIYTEVGSTVDLSAIYRVNSLHAVGDVLTELDGLVMDGADFFAQGGSYTTKLVPEKGYALPESIQMYTRYSYGEGSYYDAPRYADSMYGYYYNKETGVITVNYAPTGATSKLLIVASGVADADNTSEPVLSGETYTRPDGIYGPFDWEVVEGDGELELFDYVNNYGESYECAHFTPASVGNSSIKISSKDGKYSMIYQVVSSAVQANKLTVESHNVEVKAGTTVDLTATLSPEPSLEKDAELIWTSFNPEVATVENGTITAVKEGYAYIRVASRANTKLTNYIIVHVLPGDPTPEENPNPVPSITPGTEGGDHSGDGDITGDDETGKEEIVDNKIPVVKEPAADDSDSDDESLVSDEKLVTSNGGKMGDTTTATDAIFVVVLGCATMAYVFYRRKKSAK